MSTAVRCLDVGLLGNRAMGLCPGPGTVCCNPWRRAMVVRCPVVLQNSSTRRHSNINHAFRTCPVMFVLITNSNCNWYCILQEAAFALHVPILPATLIGLKFIPESAGFKGQWCNGRILEVRWKLKLQWSYALAVRRYNKS